MTFVLNFRGFSLICFFIFSPPAKCQISIFEMTVPQILQLLICHDHSVMPEKDPALNVFQTILLMDREFRYAWKSIQLENITAVWHKIKWQWPLHAVSVRLKTQLPASSYTTLLLLKVQCVKIGDFLKWHCRMLSPLPPQACAQTMAAFLSQSVDDRIELCLVKWCLYR